MSKDVKLIDIARRAGVHPSTVSRALDPSKSALVSEDTRARVETVADQLGYRVDAVASGFRRGRSHSIGVVVADLANPFIAPIIRGIENSLDGLGYLACVTETRDDHDGFNRALDHLLRRRVDALVTTAARKGDERALLGAAKRTPVVLAVRDLADTGLPGVMHDDYLGGRLAAEHLIGLGHQRVAQILGPQDVSSFVARGRGFGERLGAARVEQVDVGDAAVHPDLSEGCRIMRKLLRLNEKAPTAVFAHNDLMAVGALEALLDAGLDCPADIALIGYNDTQLTAHLRRALTTIKLPGYELGRFAADMAIVRIDHPAQELTTLMLPPTLIPRESTLGSGTTPRAVGGQSANRRAIRRQAS
jgi:LacI family transcriptional regulator